MGKHGLAEERIERFYTPEPNTGCWLWLGGQSMMFRTAKGGGSDSAQRYLYERKYGDLPKNTVIKRRCLTDICINPDRLKVSHI